jgi:hypothetical protein
VENEGPRGLAAPFLQSTVHGYMPFPAAPNLGSDKLVGISCSSPCTVSYHVTSDVVDVFSKTPISVRLKSTPSMAALRVPTLRNVVFGAAPYLRLSQRRWAQVHDVRFLATQQSDRVLQKYKEKLERKARELV